MVEMPIPQGTDDWDFPAPIDERTGDPPRDAEAGPSGRGTPAVAERALVRLHEYLETVLSAPDAEGALLGAMGGILMKMLLDLYACIDGLLQEPATPAERLPVVMQGIEAALRLTRQLAGLAHLRLVLSGTREALRRAGGGGVR